MVVSVFATTSLVSLQTEGESVSGLLSLPVQSTAVMVLHCGKAGAGLTVQGLLSFPRECHHEPVHLQHLLAVDVVAIRMIGEPQLVD